MITYDELKRLRYYDAAIAAAEERKADLRRKAEGMTYSLTGMPRSSSRRDKMAEYVVKLESLEESLSRDVIEMVELENRVREEIKKLPAQQAIVIHYRYLAMYRGKRLSWAEVARRTTYSMDHCWKIHRAAIKNLCGVSIK